MPRIARLLAAAIIQALAAHAAATSVPERHAPEPAGVPGHSACEAMLDSLDRLHAAADPAYLAWDFAGLGCGQDQLYQAYRRQGFGSLLASDWLGAALNLELARSIGGPEDEDLLFQLWTAWRHLDRPGEERSAARELLERFPDSPYLADILEDRRPEDRAVSRRWRGSFETRLARSRVASVDQDLSNRLKGETGQEAGGHVFRESAALSLKSNVGRRALEGIQAELAVGWRYGGFDVEAGWGLGYDARASGDTPGPALSGSGDGARNSGWSGGVGRLDAGWTGSLPGGPDLLVRAGASLHSRDWRSVGATASPAWNLGTWSLTGLLDVRHHAMRWSVRSAEALVGGDTAFFTYSMHGMQTVQASVTPGRTSGVHALELELAYLLTRYSSLFTFDFQGLAESERDAAVEHSFVLAPAWRWRLSPRLAFRLSASFGYDFAERGDSVPACREWLPGHCADEAYGADAGVSLFF